MKFAITAGVVAGAMLMSSAFAQGALRDAAPIAVQDAQTLKEWNLPAEYANDPEIVAWIESFVAELKPRSGRIDINSANATLNMSDRYYFLGAKDARRVLEEGWNNPPDESVLGMILPAGATPFDEGAWAATISYEADGYVSDEDAAEIDYDGLLSEIQASAHNENKWRTQNGYEAIDIIGWADEPTYNPATHKMYWAKELKFGESAVNTLNYDIRVLGRRGVLVIGFIADMADLQEIKHSAPAILKMASFKDGAAYADYQPGRDKKAAYGLAGLVAGAAIAKKTGLIAAVLLFGKKFIVLIFAGLAAMAGGVKRFFSTRA